MSPAYKVQMDTHGDKITHSINTCGNTVFLALCNSWSSQAELHGSRYRDVVVTITRDKGAPHTGQFFLMAWNCFVIGWSS